MQESIEDTTEVIKEPTPEKKPDEETVDEKDELAQADAQSSLLLLAGLAILVYLVSQQNAAKVKKPIAEPVKEVKEPASEKPSTPDAQSLNNKEEKA
jgi:hypothetical protein